MLSEINQTHKDMFRTFSFVCGNQTVDFIEVDSQGMVIRN